MTLPCVAILALVRLEVCVNVFVLLELMAPSETLLAVLKANKKVD